MGKSISAEMPPKFYDFGKTKQVNYNVSKKEREGIVVYEYDTVTVDKLDYSHIIRKLIAERYSIEDELALINNHIADPAMYEGRYNEYQSYRAECKLLATQILTNYDTHNPNKNHLPSFNRSRCKE